MNRDYDRVARAIEYLNAHFREQPSLDAVAAHVHLSPYHFQRLFTRWAGISPKRFLQYLTLDYTRRLLRESRDLLSASEEAGLSGPGRLHDLYVTITAMTPGEYKNGGAELDIRYGVHDSPFGSYLIALTDKGICALRFLDTSDADAAEALLRAEWPQAMLYADAKVTAPLAQELFASGGTFSLHVKGTNFQLQVWSALVNIPAGSVVAYGDIAARIGAPGASRAVGGAVGSNPIAYLIPCHRVIQESGRIGGYRWQPVRKQALLAHEAARHALAVTTDFGIQAQS